MENINVKASGITFALVSTILSLLCALSYWLFPNILIRYFNYITHGIDITPITTRSISLINVLIGLVIVFISAYLIGILFGIVYNYFNKNNGGKKWKK